MQIEYDSKIRKYFDSYTKLKKIAGLELARSIKKRIDQLTASKDLHSYLSFKIGNPHWLNGDFKNCIGINLNANYRLIIFIDIENKDVETLKLCDFVIVKGVSDYHGSKSNWIIP